ncbi:hydrophobin [Phlebiopsis gigantea 11061_1 CR5-6]|uniref:Hydrophobin n=1 Tax=Phlebiopsis gigantea (strain 11061_1 CR5-6) TaxID=745531 RepID=A0A0C3SD59_PHLG1|nr:hydrophobin [Phlebiopsis gigantea 11061_1 CR5-6]
MKFALVAFIALPVFAVASPMEVRQLPNPLCDSSSPLSALVKTCCSGPLGLVTGILGIIPGTNVTSAVLNVVKSACPLIDNACNGVSMSLCCPSNSSGGGVLGTNCLVSSVTGGSGLGGLGGL